MIEGEFGMGAEIGIATGKMHALDEINNRGEFAKFMLTPAIKGQPDTKPCHLISAFIAKDSATGFCKIMEEDWWEPVLDVDTVYRNKHTKMSFYADDARCAAMELKPIVNELKDARRITLSNREDIRSAPELKDLRVGGESIVLPYGERELWSVETFVPRLSNAVKTYVEDTYQVNSRVMTDEMMPQ